jgi:hypothetical protein
LPGKKRIETKPAAHGRRFAFFSDRPPCLQSPARYNRFRNFVARLSIAGKAGVHAMRYRNVFYLLTAFAGFGILHQRLALGDPAGASTQPGDTAGRCALLIEGLNNTDAEVADGNELSLWQMGTSADAQLVKATTDSRKAVSRRASEVLSLIQMGCTREKPEQLFWQTLKFKHATTVQQRQEAARELQKIGMPAGRVMLRLLASEGDLQTCALIWQSLPQIPFPQNSALSLVQSLYYSDNFGPAELEDLTTYVQAEALFGRPGDYVAVVTIAGAGKDAIAQWHSRYNQLEAATTQPDDSTKADAESQRRVAGPLLVALYRAQGDLPAALAMAKKASLDYEVDSLLEESGAWLERAQRVSNDGPKWPKSDEFLNAVEFLKQSQYWRFAGNDAKADEQLVKARQTFGDNKQFEANWGNWLLLCEQVDEGIGHLKATQPIPAFQLMRERLDFDGALQLKADPGAYGAEDLLHEQQLLKIALGLLPTPPPSAAPTTKSVDEKYDDMMHLWWLDEKSKPIFESAVSQMRGKDYLKAAEKFDQLWRTPMTGSSSDPPPRNPGALYLRGYCRLKAGLKEQGERDMQQASLCPLSDRYQRYLLGLELSEAGLSDERAHQAELNLRMGGSGDNGYGDAVLEGHTDAELHSDWSRAAHLYRLDLLSLLSSSTGSSSNTAYLDIPWNIHLNQARADRDAGNLPATMEQLRACNKLIPGNSDLAIEWVPQMDARHEPAMADELFNASYGRWDRLSQKYPRSGWMHNVAAWTAANCNRKPSEAVSHARIAVQLAPTNWAFLDTLAEAEFHAGHRDLAIAAARQALAAQPKTDFLEQRLKHFTNDPLPLH